MFIDSRKIPSDTVIKTDVCVIGAGAAGITLCKEFAGEQFQVCLLESGGLKPDKDTQSLYEGESIGLIKKNTNYLTLTRARFFGGTTNLWMGLCVPIEENAFEHRPWVPYSEWPFSRAELISYYRRAQRFCGLGPFIYDPADSDKKGYGFQPLPFRSNRVITRFNQLSKPPTRFGKVYREDIEKADNIKVYLYANAINFETTENNQQVTQTQIVTLGKNKFWVKAKIFILATGGIENARLLLLSDNNGKDASLGNRYDLVGRYFMEHPNFPMKLKEQKIISSIKSADMATFRTYYFKRFFKLDKRPFFSTLSIADEIQAKEKLLNVSVLIRGPRRHTTDYFEKAVGNMIADLDADFIGGDEKDRARNKKYKMFFYNICAEQSPNPDSRVMLSSKRDKFGLNRVKLDWRLSSLDIRSIRKSIKIIAEEFGRAKLGRVRMFNDDELSWRKKVTGVSHHMGTTRMSSNPKKGVVDKDCLIHGISNIYIAGSSVFPTVGTANPTLTIVALATRLADHIKNIINNI